MASAPKRNPLFGIRPTRSGEMGQTAREMDLVPGQRLFYWIGQAAKARREDAGLRLEKLAADTGMGKETFDRFEKGRTRPHELEAMLVSYAKLTELGDPRDIVAAGLRLWYQSGVNPADEVQPEPAQAVQRARRRRAQGQ